MPNPFELAQVLTETGSAIAETAERLCVESTATTERAAGLALPGSSQSALGFSSVISSHWWNSLDLGSGELTGSLEQSLSSGKALAAGDAQALSIKAAQSVGMTDRGMSDYQRFLMIPDRELNKSGSLILDVGSGVRQRFAREMSQLGYKSTVVSIDPRLSLSEEADLNGFGVGSRALRLQGRRFPAPLTISAIGQQLPFSAQSVDSIYALYSVPHYLLDDTTAIGSTLSEFLRVLKPGSFARMFPVENPEVVESVASSLDGKYSLARTYFPELGGAPKWRLTVTPR